LYDNTLGIERGEGDDEDDHDDGREQQGESFSPKETIIPTLP
jgi:hypothetical protein